jgi:exonuclease SbcD
VLLGLEQITSKELFAGAWEEQCGNPAAEQTLDEFATLLQRVEFAHAEDDR